ncbi:MAG: hypothetical protein LUF87_08400 [Alistipes sp.]|nr:hypothetical protein [Alistipes sp.]
MKKILNRQYPELDGFTDELTRGGFDRGGEYLHDGRNKVKVFEVDGRRVVVKRFKQPHLFNRLVYTFVRGSKAGRAYRNANLLLEKGIATPTVIACVDKKRRGLIAESYLVTEYTDFKAVRDLRTEEKYIRAMGENKYIEYAVLLHTKGINHKDFTNTNVLYRLNDDLSFDFMLIDVNRMSFGRMTRYTCIASLKKIAEDSDSIFVLTEKYARQRGWNLYFCHSVIAAHRGMWENRKKAKASLRRILGRKREQ